MSFFTVDESASGNLLSYDAGRSHNVKALPKPAVKTAAPKAALKKIVSAVKPAKAASGAGYGDGWEEF